MFDDEKDELIEIKEEVYKDLSSSIQASKSRRGKKILYQAKNNGYQYCMRCDK